MRIHAAIFPFSFSPRQAFDSTWRTGVLAAVLIACAVPACATRFIPVPPTFDSGGVPQQVLTADVNKDGLVDLIVSNDNGKITLLLGKGGGTFAKPATVATLGGGAPQLVIADFNNDGVPDLAVLAKAAATVAVYLGHGDGTFATPSKASTPASPAQMSVGDVNGDGHTDVVVVTRTGLTALPGDGLGGLGPGIKTTSSVGGLILALGDVNGDGRLDVIVGGGDTDTEFLGLGDGHFKQTANQVDAPAFMESQMLLADLDGDGNLDLVVAADSNDPRITGAINISWGNGDGTFQLGTKVNAGMIESSVVVADFNHDGTPDLAAANSYSNSASIVLNKGGRRFGPAVPYRTNKMTFIPSLPDMLAAADVRGDGLPGLAIATLTGVQVLKNVGGGILYAPGAVQLAGTGADLFALQMNGDSHTDVVVESIAPFGFGTILALYGDGTGQFPQRFNPYLNEYFDGLAIGDLNRDGRLDIAYGSSDNGVFTLYNDGTNNLATGPSLNSVFGPVAGDFNNDGFSDLAVNDGNSIILYLNSGNGTFSPKGTYTVNSRTVPVKAVDINKDGKRDLVLVDGQSAALTVLLGKGDGTFQPARSTPVKEIPTGFTVGDFNRDGKLDIALAGPHFVEVLLGHGDGSFAAGPSYPVASAVYALNQTDLRHDDKEDLLFVDGKFLWVMYGNGNGSFQAQVSFEVGPNPIAMTVGDFNEDGAPDLAVSDAQSTSLTLLLNAGGTRISFSASAPSVRSGQPVTLKATITPSVPGVMPVTGTVALKDGPKGIGFVRLVNGRASFTTSALSPGTHTLTASYWETSAFNPHVSSPVTITVTP